MRGAFENLEPLPEGRRIRRAKGFDVSESRQRTFGSLKGGSTHVTVNDPARKTPDQLKWHGAFEKEKKGKEKESPSPKRKGPVVGKDPSMMARERPEEIYHQPVPVREPRQISPKAKPPKGDSGAFR